MLLNLIAANAVIPHAIFAVVTELFKQENKMSEQAKDLFEHAWAETGRAEGGYVNDPSDSGGETNHGITERVARNHGFMGRMRDLTAENAREIAKRAYWDVMRLDEIARINGGGLIAKELFDTGFNIGPNRAVTFLQRSLNALNRNAKDYADVLVDGDLGPATLQAFTTYYRFRYNDGIEVLYRALNSLQCAFYIKLVERRAKDEKFLYGWIKNRVA